MKVKPILFSTPMVQAILDARKSMTRRVVHWDISNKFDIESDHKTIVAYIDQETGDSYKPEKLCRYQPGDVLYVRETWRLIDFEYIDGQWSASVQFKDMTIGNRLFWGEDGADQRLGWRPSIFMPKAAARIWLKVTDVSVERLGMISDADVLAEGVQTKEEYFELWDSLNLERGYGVKFDPWVWRIRFERVDAENGREN